jgi:hypothetical protein
MRHGCTVAAAAVVIAGFTLPSAAIADCNVRNPTACTSDSQPQAAAPPQASAAKPLQLKRFMQVGPVRRSASRSGKRRVAKPAKQATEETGKAAVRSFAEVKAPLAPKPVTTLSIGGPAVAIAPAVTDGTVGFAAATEPWAGTGAFASDEPAALPSGVSIARFDEVNEIDLAADTEAMAQAHAGKSDRMGVSLTSPANAAIPVRAAVEPASEPKQSWLSWLYEKLADGVLTAVLAIRSFFV